MIKPTTVIDLKSALTPISAHSVPVELSLDEYTFHYAGFVMLRLKL